MVGAAPAAVIAAVFPPLIVLNASLLSEPLFIVIELAMVLAVFAARRRANWRWAAVAGALCGLGALTRSNGSLLVILAMWGVWTVRPRLSRQALLAPAAALVAMILVIVPWTVRNAFTFHRFVPITTQSGFALAGVFNDGARTFPSYPGTWVLPEVQTRYAHMYQDRSLNEVRLDQKQRSSALSYAIHHIPYAAEEVGLNFLRILSLAPSARLANHADDLQLGVKPHWVQPLKWSWFVLGAIAIGGIVVLLRAPPSRRGPPWFWTIPVLMVLVAAAVIGSHRYRVPAYPFAIFLAAIALNQVGIMVGLLQSSSEAVVGA
jgi:4-amino-4-deoxy-L-arabinose transferase-like glycosyltransferase